MKRALAFLTFIHRWLGVVFCLIVFIWFASGIVMVYKRMPAFTPEERLERLTPLDPDRVLLTPLDAATRAGVQQLRRVRLVTIAARPAYQFLAQQKWVTIFADTGARLEPLTNDQALALTNSVFADHAGERRYLALLSEPDQWTFSASIRTTGPLHKIALGDERATEVYVARDSGEIVMKTDRSGRFWGYAGAVLHWFYFTPLRLRSGLWAALIIYGSLVGCVLCLSGLVVGFTRFSAARRYRGGTSRTPYAGWLRWHHYAGLLFGVVTFTWTLSGMLSMTPWNWSPGASPSASQVQAVRGGPLRLDGLTVSPADAVRLSTGAVRELELLQFLGMPFYEVRGQDPLYTTALSATAPGQRTTPLSRADLMRAAEAAMPGQTPVEQTWLTHYDAYYYDKSGRRPLPVLRVKYNDPDRTWLYLSARDGQLLRREVSRSRIERWLYHGLHSLDFPWLYQTRGLWDVVVISLSLGGVALSFTSLVIAVRFLRRRVTT